jgi:protein-S-isoprenylcysteine O-methyltransferase Ste14
MLLLLLASVVHWTLPIARIEIFASGVLAAVAGGLGFGVMMWAWWLFQKAETAICPTAESSTLVTSGIYGFTRNPMYLGIIMMMIAAALWFGTLTFYLIAGLYFLIINQVFCPFEEGRLEITFGKKFFEYRQKVRRWF